MACQECGKLRKRVRRLEDVQHNQAEAIVLLAVCVALLVWWRPEKEKGD